MNGAKSLTTTLNGLGVDTVFGYPGGAIMPVYDALPDQLRHILCRHEQGAAFAAQGYAKVTGKPGVCLATSGPGATNLVTGIADAWMDSIPVLAITGQVPQDLIGTNAFQEIDIIEMTRGIVKASFQIRNVDDISVIVQHAYNHCRSGRPGPVLIDIPKDVQKAMVTGSSCWAPSPKWSINSNREIDSDDIAKAQALLKTAERPIIMAGGGVKAAGAGDKLRQLAEHLCCDVVTTLNGIGLLPKEHVNHLGMLGMHGSEQTNDAVQNCDLLIGLGVRFDDRATGKVEGFAPNAKIIHVDMDPSELNKNVTVDLAIQGDVDLFIDQLLACTPKAGQFASSEHHELSLCPTTQSRHPGPPQGSHPQSDEKQIDIMKLLSSLGSRLQDNTYVTVDVGQHQMWTAQEVPFRHADQFLTSGGLGTMGFGLPAAIGAQIAHPEATVINITGDGSFMMNLQELATANRYQLPIKILLVNNNHLGLVRQQQELFYDQRYSEVDLSDNPDFCQLTQIFGFANKRITLSNERSNEKSCEERSEKNNDKSNQVSSALDWLTQTDGPALLEVVLPHHQNVWPFVVPGESNDVRLSAPNKAVAR